MYRCVVCGYTTANGDDLFLHYQFTHKYTPGDASAATKSSGATEVVQESIDTAITTATATQTQTQKQVGTAVDASTTFAQSTYESVEAKVGSEILDPGLLQIESGLEKAEAYYRERYSGLLGFVKETLDKAKENSDSFIDYLTRIPGAAIETGAEVTGDLIADAFTKGISNVLNKSIMGDVSRGTELGEIMAAQAPEVVKPGSPAIRKGYEDAELVVTRELSTNVTKLIAYMEAGHSPISPEAAAILQSVVSGGSLAAFIGLSAAGIAIEGATLGQMEIPGHALLQLASMYGLSHMAGAIVTTPYRWAADVGANYYWASKFTPMKLNVAEAGGAWVEGFLSRDGFHEHIRYSGFPSEYDAYLEHEAYRPLAPRLLVKLAEVGGYDDALFSEELKHSRYRPEVIERLKTYLKAQADKEGVSEAMTVLRKHVKEGFMTTNVMVSEAAKYKAEPDPVKRQIMVAQWEYEFDYKSDTRSLILDQFARGNIDKTTATAQLSEIMPAAERVTRLLDRYELKIKEEKIKVEKAAEPPALTKAEILSAFKAGRRTETWAREQLVVKGYSAADIDFYIEAHTPPPA